MLAPYSANCLNNLLMKKLFFLILLCGYPITSLLAQTSGDECRSIVSSTIIGFGTSDILDTYLTPLDYRGWNINLRNERLQVAKRGNNNRLNQQFLWGSYTSNDNEAQNGMVISGFIGYSWGTLWQYHLTEKLTIAGGPMVRGESGFIYNLRNGNNPASAKISFQAGGSALAIYRFQAGKLPLTLRYQVTLPMFGTFFSPHYEQSYYEIFVLGNSSGIIHFGSFHNQFDLDNYVTLDIPVSSINLRVGFLSTIRNTHVNDIKNRHVDNSFIIGFSKEFLPFNRKKAKKSLSHVVSPLF